MKIAVAYHNTEPGNVSANLQEILKMLSFFEREQICFALFPELNLSGYVTSEQKIKELQEQKAESFMQLQEFSRNSQVAFAIGFPEEENDKYYITHFFFERGKITGKHRKTHLGPTERPFFSAGNQLQVFKAGKLMVGMQLCFETHFPEISYAQAKQGANLLAMGFASPKETAAEKLERFKRHLCARAYDNACYALVCNQSGQTSRGATFPGLAMIIDPKGKVLAEETKAGDGYCIANFETGLLERIYQSKMAWFNNFKRNEILSRFYE